MSDDNHQRLDTGRFAMDLLSLLVLLIVWPALTIVFMVIWTSYAGVFFPLYGMFGVVSLAIPPLCALLATLFLMFLLRRTYSK